MPSESSADLSAATPPMAKQVPSTRSFHGDDVVDAYAWLRERDDPDTVAYLEAENAYTLAATAHTKALQDTIFGEIKARTLETDISVPLHKGGWFYYSRTVEGSQYAISCRSRTEPSGTTQTPTDPAVRGTAVPPDEVVLLDQNLLAGNSPYFAVGTFDVSPDGDLLAYSTDFDGSEKFTLQVKDLRTDELLPDRIPGTFYGSAWSKDRSTLFYSTVDAAMRPYRIWRHRLGTDASDDELVHEETDQRFFTGVSLTRSEDWIVLSIGSMITSEVKVLRADDPLGDFRVVAHRRQGVEYSLDHSGDTFWILHNDQAPNFELARAPVDDPGPDSWTTVIRSSTAVRLDDVNAFESHLAVSLRRDGFTSVQIHPLLPDGAIGEAHEIELPEVVHTVGVGSNREFSTNTLRIAYTSLVTPGSVYDYDIGRRDLRLRKQQPLLGGVDITQYESAREWATAQDGSAVPISLVWRRGTPRDGTAPGLLYGYGSYEASVDPWFSTARLSLLDRGFVFAVAHVRGGGEMGRHWYEQGKLTAKRTTFTDFVSAADRLVEAGWVAPDRIVARGASAGGLLMGAVANLAPERFAGIVAEVPFVDALSTILDPTLPLTVLEWEEWGNPVESPEVYAYMKSYSPYENVRPVPYPAILATAGLNDPRVGYHEPAKWVARLRATATGDRPLLLKTEMGAGHGGPSGRYDAWHDEAFVLAFVLDTVGAAD